ncbi:ubiquitin carboxyl-terminal hydrolase [Criblamydia sequanensis]|uniref:USP domain-containing protein n=1 Tax=Candidatus Criblamydia sequanensis CRIB-18 TaxID=1437425 RepID=A0A090D0L0_9BACT|nr:ubiquitin carboxyl-terminal hydrolase family protein [Criblamydia sequanensis]CDR35077.1 hypothetical protein CSEC_2271 [Criblamydia sequanensis CRIB-18]
MEDLHGIFGFSSPTYSVEDFEYSPIEYSQKVEDIAAVAYGSLYQIEELNNPSPSLDGRAVKQRTYALPKNTIELQSLYNSLSIEEKKKFTETLHYLFNYYEKWVQEEDSKVSIFNSIQAHGGTLAFSLDSPFIEDLLEPLAQTFKEKDHPLIDSAYTFFLRCVLRISNAPFPVYSYRDQNLDFLKSISPSFAEIVDRISQENEFPRCEKDYFNEDHAIAMRLLLKKNIIFFKNNLHALLQPRVEGQAKLLKDTVVTVCLLKKCASRNADYHKVTKEKNTVDIYSDNFFVAFDENGFPSSFKHFNGNNNFIRKHLSKHSLLEIDRLSKTVISDETRKELANYLLDPKKAQSCEILLLFHKTEEVCISPFLETSYHYEDLALNTGIKTSEVLYFLKNPLSPNWKAKGVNIPSFRPINPNSPKVSDLLKLQKLYRTLPLDEKNEITKTLSFLFDAFESWLSKFQRSRFLSECLNSYKGLLSLPLQSKHLMSLFVTLAHHFENQKNDRVETAHRFFLKHILNLTTERVDIEESLFKKIIGKVSLKYVDILFEAAKINPCKVNVFEISKTDKVKPTHALALFSLLLKSLCFFKNNPEALIEPQKNCRNKKFLRHQEVSVWLIRKQPSNKIKNPYINPSNIYVNEIGLPASIVSYSPGVTRTKSLSIEESQKWIGLIENSSRPEYDTIPFFLFYKIEETFFPNASLTQKTYFEDFACNLGLSTAEVLFFLKNPKSYYWFPESVQLLDDFNYLEAFDKLVEGSQNEKKSKKRKEPPSVKKTREPSGKRIKEADQSIELPKVPNYVDNFSPVSTSSNSMACYFRHKQFFDKAMAALESFNERGCQSPKEMAPILVQQPVTLNQSHPRRAQNQTQASYGYYLQKTIETSLSQKFSLETQNTHPVRGFQNIGNSCYINAALQILNHIPFFRNSINNQKYLDLPTILASDIHATLRAPGITLDLSNLNAFINNIQKQGSDREPVDHSEFSKPANSIALKYLVKKAFIEKGILDSLKEIFRLYSAKVFPEGSIIQSISHLRSYLFQTIYYPETNLESMQDPVQVLEKIFFSLNMHTTLIKEKFSLGGKIRLGQREEQLSTILQLSLPPDSKNLTLQELIDLNFSRVVLHDDDPLRTLSETGEIYESKDWEEEYSLENPNTKYLVFQLKRYYQTTEGEFHKNSNLFTPSKVLNLARAFKSKNPKFYQLKAAILHDDYGSNKTNFGHYTSLVEIKGDWHLMNDWKVTRLPFPEKMLSESYIFVLEAVE